MHHMRRKEASSLGYTMVKEVQLEKGKKELCVVFTGKWDVIEGMENWGQGGGFSLVWE